MPFMLTKPRGFTLVEMLIITPIIMLVVLAIVGFIVALTGDVLQSRERTRIIYDIQTSLDRIEQDVLIGNQFNNSLAASSPQGPGANGASGTFQASSALIVEQNATTKRPLDPDRQIVYLRNQPNPCGSNQQYNENLKLTAVYFVRDSTLYRRTIVPQTPTCDSPWQRNSCPEGFNISTSVCRALDESLMKNVDEFNVTYLESVGGDAVADSAAEAGAIDIEIRARVEVAGNDIVQTGSLRASSINALE